MSKYDDSRSGHDWESEVSRELDHRVRDLHEAPFTLDQVKGRATSIRRHRRLAAAGGILAVAAVVVPVAVFAGKGLTGDDSRRPVLPATSSPSPTDGPTDGPTEGATEAIDEGSSLDVDYLEGSTWVRPDGTTVELGTTYQAGTMLGADLLGVRNDDETGQHFLDVVEPSGEVVESIEFVSGLAVNDDRTTAAYVTPAGDLMTLWDPSAGEDGRVSMATGLSASETPVAVLGGPSCYEAVDGCRVFYDFGDGSTPPHAVDSHGIDDEFVFADPTPLRATDATAGGLVSVQTASRQAGSCNGLYDEQAGSYRWETCDRFLLDLSPSGAHVATTQAYLDGIGNGYVAIVDTDTEAEVARLDPEDGFVATQMWESDDSLLAMVYDAGAWSIWRLGTDGSTEQVVGPSTEGDDLTPAFTLLRGM